MRSPRRRFSCTDGPNSCSSLNPCVQANTQCSTGVAGSMQGAFVSFCMNGARRAAQPNPPCAGFPVSYQRWRALRRTHPPKPCTAPAATPDIPAGALPNGNGGLCYSSLTACLNGRVLPPQAHRPRPTLLPRRVRARLLRRRRWARSPNICSAAEPCVDQPSLCNTGTSGGTNNSWCARASRCPRRFVSAAEPLLSSISARACFLQDLHAVDARTRASNGCALPLRQVRPLCTRSCFTACVARSRVPPPAWQGRATSAT